MEWKKIVGGIAPTIATALGGPLAGKAVSFLAQEFLGNPDATEEQVAAAIVAATPEERIKLKELDNTFRLEMQKLKLDESRVALDNTVSARGLFSIDKAPQTNLSYLVVGGFFAVLIGLIILFAWKGNAIPSEANLLLGTLIGSLATYVGLILKFWFGGKPDDADQMNKLYYSIPPGHSTPVQK